MIVVISTTGNPPPDAKARCLASVAAQIYSRCDTDPYQMIGARHFYLEPPLRDDGFPHFPALIEVIARLPDDAIVVSLDGDDWLAGPDSLARVQREHDAGALVTYGSFRYADGRSAPWTRALAPGERIRQAPWVTSHLKTFRAGLFRRIEHRHLQDEQGQWLEHARDHALMFPLVEMAGDRARHIPDVLCVYNAANSAEFRHGAPEIAAERAAAAYLRALPSYEALPCST